MNKKPRTSAGSPRDEVPMIYCRDIFQGQAWTVRLLSAGKEGGGQKRRGDSLGTCLLACPLPNVALLKDTDVALE